MDNFWEHYSFDDTIRDFDFTRRAVNVIHRVVSSSDFEYMDSETIFKFLHEEMEIVSFHEYLKRFLYLNAGIEEPFQDVPDTVYMDIISSSFEETRTPHSLSPSTRRWSVTLKKWLSADSVRRQSVFLLGFGLRMDAHDVNEFLTKVLKEESFRPCDPAEVIFSYCFHYGYPYSAARQLMDWYDWVAPSENTCSETTFFMQYSSLYHDGLTASVGLPAFHTESELKSYLASLKAANIAGTANARLRACYDTLLKEAARRIASMYNQGLLTGKTIPCKSESVTPADFETVISCGIPRTKSGNLRKMSASLLCRQFRQKRLTRQRMEAIENGTVSIDRFDLITLQFFIFSQEMPDAAPEQRCLSYLDSINPILESCRMQALYPANPYEAFILMCLLSEEPLTTYTDVWEASYQAE